MIHYPKSDQYLLMKQAITKDRQIAMRRSSMLRGKLGEAILDSKGKIQNRLTPLVSLAGLFFGGNLFVGFGLIGIGAAFAVIDIFRKMKQGKEGI